MDHQKYLTFPIRVLLLFSLIFLIVGGLAFTRQDMGLMSTSQGSTHNHLYYLPKSKTLKRISAGFRTALADLIWIRALLYTGTHFSLKERGGIHWLNEYAQTITDLDPKFMKVYVWGSVLLLYNRYNISRTNVLQSIALLQKGRKAFPDSFYYPKALGLSYLFEIKLNQRDRKGLQQDHLAFCHAPMPPKLKRVTAIKKIRKCLRQIAARYIMEAAAKEEAPSDLAMLAANLMKKGGSNKVGICNHLLDVLWQSNDDIRKQIRARLKRYCGPKELKTILCRERLFRNQWKKEFPYIPPSLFALLAPQNISGDLRTNIHKTSPHTGNNPCE